MNVDQTPFRVLPGIGPATESRLHQNGIHTWAALADVLDAFARIKGVDVRKLRRLRDEARRHEDDPERDDEPLDERTSRFVVSVTLGPDQRVRRTSIANPLTGATHRFTGLPAAALAEAIEAELTVSSVDGASGRRAGDHSGRDEVQPGFSEGGEVATLLPALPEMHDDGPLGFAGSVAGETRTVDAGPVIGGVGDEVVVKWDTTDIDSGDSDRFGYTTTVSAKPYGSAPSSWTMLGQRRGTARRGEIVEFNLDRSSLTRDVYRLALSFNLRPGGGNGA